MTQDLSQSPDNMRRLSKPLWTRAYAQAVDQLSSERFHLPPAVLMETAGRLVAQEVLDLGASDRPVVVLAGSGNNGGDALVAARVLADCGVAVQVFGVYKDAGQPGLSDLGALQLRIIQALKIPFALYKKGALAPFTALKPIIIDGVLGLGFRGPLQPGALVDALQEAGAIRGRHVLAVDVPSGMDPDLGDQTAPPLPADVCVTFGGAKMGQAVAPSRDFCGQIVVAEIGFPRAALKAASESIRSKFFVADPLNLLELNPWKALPKSAHKYDRGHVLVIGGSVGKTGAPYLAAVAALRAGAGWATVALPEGTPGGTDYPAPPELTFEALFRGARVDGAKLKKFLTERRVRAVVVGPGCMEQPLDDQAMDVLADFSSRSEGFLVFDGGGLHQLLPMMAGKNFVGERTLLTPHPGEWKKLGGEILAEPTSENGVNAVAARAHETGTTLVYKGATPIVIGACDPAAQSSAYVFTRGTHTLARAGTGDVLAGVCAAHGAMGFAAIPAALRSLAVVAACAERAAAEVGSNAVLATDMISKLGLV